MDIRTREVEDIFYKYGRIRDIDVKFPSRPPAFAFVDFEDARDAEDAIRGRDGYDYDGARLRVEPANGGRRESARDSARGSARYPRNVRGNGEFSVEVSNLPPRVSWQDLKDFMRKAGDVVFTEVDGRGGGVVEYSNKRDMKYAKEKEEDDKKQEDGKQAASASEKKDDEKDTQLKEEPMKEEPKTVEEPKKEEEPAAEPVKEVVKEE
ncbi:hypothetical protein JG688_00006220 [Phytophthora aleatoria]|uniref:RRM domain-containing protein n=1 Tax=Phytophthora aleatoria TaxID=2496075 RepID=A0A8J5IZU7_9STRA|nr:hypothetical protein JG688_00006220 [Phytophthora aleatoria]